MCCEILQKFNSFISNRNQVDTTITIYLRDVNEVGFALRYFENKVAIRLNGKLHFLESDSSIWISASFRPIKKPENPFTH